MKGGVYRMLTIHPVYRRFLIVIFIFPVFLQEPPQVEPGTGVVRTGDDDVRQRDAFIPFFGYDRIAAFPGLPRVTEKTVDAGDKRRRLVQPQFRLAEQLAADVCFRDSVGVESRQVQPRMSQSL